MTHTHTHTHILNDACTHTHTLNDACTHTNTQTHRYSRSIPFDAEWDWLELLKATRVYMDMVNIYGTHAPARVISDSCTANCQLHIIMSCVFARSISVSV